MPQFPHIDSLGPPTQVGLPFILDIYVFNFILLISSLWECSWIGCADRLKKPAGMMHSHAIISWLVDSMQPALSTTLYMHKQCAGVDISVLST